MLGLVKKAILTAVLIALSPNSGAAETVTDSAVSKKACLTCHEGIERISEFHPFDCTVCHEGDPDGKKLEAAHKGLVASPGSYPEAERICGRCHEDIFYRVQRSPMKTLQATINKTRFSLMLRKKGDDAVYGYEPPASFPNLKPFVPGSRVESKMEKNCLSACHQGVEGPKIYGGYHKPGCSACHYLTDNDGLYKGGDAALPGDKPGYGRLHRLTTAIPFTQCNHCHNRYSRDLMNMEVHLREDIGPSFDAKRKKTAGDHYLPLDPLAPCEKILDCIDCHTHREIMGYGTWIPDKKERLEVECVTCHGTPESPPRSTILRKNDKSLKFIMVNPNLRNRVKEGDRVVLTERGNILYNVGVTEYNGYSAEGGYKLLGKVHNKVYRLPVIIGSSCGADASETRPEHCYVCHDVSDEQGGGS
ncbi:MAG: hypothetical protein IEMM0002_1553 [bacterium]|nr:MAG: hypothetical protein IEMM0002_1553 [bacterium]